MKMPMLAAVAALALTAPAFAQTGTAPLAGGATGPAGPARRKTHRRH